MGRSFGRMVPLWISYVILFGLSALGPALSQYGGIGRGNWVFLFLMPFAIGSVPYSFIMGEVIQHRTRASSRAAWRWGLFHMVVIYAIFIVGIFDMLLETRDILYYIVWIAPAFASGLFFVLGMLIMRKEQAHSDARYGVEVSRGDPWASFFDLQWEDDRPRNVVAHRDRQPAEKPKRKLFSRRDS
ncbi:MAG: hypothetical protein UHS51_05120 [Atopobiaceae bacterium]|nr:hypothetical protein [Atopobiaceae bacterium]